MENREENRRKGNIIGGAGQEVQYPKKRLFRKRTEKLQMRK